MEVAICRKSPTFIPRDIINAANGETLNVIPMDKPEGDDKVRASIVAAHGQLFVRTTRKLYCVGEKQK